MELKLPFKSFYGRCMGHLSDRSKNLLKNLLPQYSLGEMLLDKRSLDAQYGKINLEIGFGSGDFIFKSTQANPQDLYIGVEVFQNGIASLLNKLEESPRYNLRIYEGNVYNLFEKFQERMFDNIFILFPDPWPKKRHRKRRILNSENLEFFAKILKPNGHLRFVSDHREYVDSALEHILASPHFVWGEKNQDISAINCKPKDHFETKYERKAKAQGLEIFYIDIVLKN